jgi:hypothetical protein
LYWICFYFVKNYQVAYPEKIILAWSEAIMGNNEIRDWLMSNGYPELALFVFALHHKREAREWLLNNKFPHLMALIECAEGREQACQWLVKFDFALLEKVARIADNDESAAQWMLEHDEKSLLRLALRIRAVKNDIQAKHDDMHFISPE